MHHSLSFTTSVLSCLLASSSTSGSGFFCLIIFSSVQLCFLLHHVLFPLLLYVMLSCSHEATSAVSSNQSTSPFLYQYEGLPERIVENSWVSKVLEDGRVSNSVSILLDCAIFINEVWHCPPRYSNSGSPRHILCVFKVSLIFL
jgi:hypothetical protein